ncbi:hypothetical protein [Leptospira wolffii]|uniref:hypothetical protein n=1 Tax=Leptospira wolffii TaxID=409998 RepID=UPI0003459015|nr:hypothetical protein [Leptospira wolffii]
MFQSERDKQEKIQLTSASGQVRREFFRTEIRNKTIHNSHAKEEKVVKLKPDLYDK